MAINLGTKTVETVELDRTFSVHIDTPVSGAYSVSIFRHVVDANTQSQLREDKEPFTLSLAEIMADADLGPLLASLPAVFDRVVTAKRAAAVAAIAAAAAARAAKIAADAAALEAARAAAAALEAGGG